MKQISTSLAPKLKEDTITERDYIVFSGETTKHYLWFQLYDDCYKDGNFIGTFILKRIEFTYNDSDLEFKNKEFNAYKEYKLDNETWEAINYGTFVVTNVDPSDTKEEITVTAYDYALKFANTYKTDLDYASGTITLFQVLQEVCQKVGVELENTSVENGNFIVDSNQFGEESLYGNVVTAIAQISCNFAKITSENKLKLMLKSESNITIDVSDYEEFEDKRDTLPYTAVTLGVSDIEGENVSLIDPDVEPDEAKYLIINDNPFAYTEEKRTQLIQAIFNKINGFGYSSFVLSNCLYPQLECGDLIKIKNKDGQLVNSIVLRPTFDEVVINFEAPSTITSTVSYVQPLSAIETAKRAERKVDKQNLIISDVVSEVGQYDNRITSVEQTVDKIEQQVNEAITLIRDVEGNGSVTLENTSNTSLYKLSIKGDISLLFGNDGQTYGSPPTQGVPYAQPLYPSPNLFGKNMNLIIEYKEDDKEVYKLPFTYLNYLSQEVADEFILEDGKAKIIRRVGINSSMQKYELPNEVLEELGDFTIPLKEGNPKIYLQCFDSAIYNATYMIKNAYTEEFATKVELNSSIKQTSEEINLSVDKKIQDLDTQLSSDITQTSEEINLEVSKKVDENEIIASINLTSEEAKINASKITLEGIVTANQNFKVLLDGSIEAKNGTFSGDITSNNAVITGGSLTIGSKFKVTNDGTLTATNGNFNGTITSSNATITGGSLSVGSKFKVTSDGTLTATGGTFNGNITASSGKIGTWNINSTGLVAQDSAGKWTGIRLPNGESKAYSFFTGATSNSGANASFVAYSDGSLYANNATIKGTINSSAINGSTITGGSIKIEGTGFFTFGTGTTHPWASAINVTGLYGLNFYTGTNASSVGSQQGYIDMGGSNGAMQMVSIYTDVVVGGYHVKLSAREGNVYASRNNGTNYLVSTDGGNISSLNLKENIKIFDDNEYEKAYKLLQKIDFYRYDYKYKISDNKKEYGFIIDYIEQNDNYDDFLYFYNQKANVENNELDYLIEKDDKNVIEFKKYDSENLLKYLFTLIKVMQIKIDKLEGMTKNE